MAKVEYRICDRCKEMISPKWPKLRYFRVPRPKVKYFSYLIGPVTHERTMELCEDCSDKLDLFLRGVTVDD